MSEVKTCELILTVEWGVAWRDLRPEPALSSSEERWRRRASSPGRPPSSSTRPGSAPAVSSPPPSSSPRPTALTAPPTSTSLWAVWTSGLSQVQGREGGATFSSKLQQICNSLSRWANCKLFPSNLVGWKFWHLCKIRKSNLAKYVLRMTDVWCEESLR